MFSQLPEDATDYHTVSEQSPRRVLLAGVSMILATLIFVTGCGATRTAAGTNAAPPPMEVSFVEARTGVVTLRNEWIGTLDGYVNAQIQPQVSGYLVEQKYREGQVV